MLINILAIAILLSVATACYIFITRDQKDEVYHTKSGHELRFLDINPPSAEALESILQGKYVFMYCIMPTENYIFIEDSLDKALKALEKYRKNLGSIHLDDHYSLRLPNGEVIYRGNIITWMDGFRNI